MSKFRQILIPRRSRGGVLDEEWIIWTKLLISLPVSLPKSDFRNILSGDHNTNQNANYRNYVRYTNGVKSNARRSINSEFGSVSPNQSRRKSTRLRKLREQLIWPAAWLMILNNCIKHNRSDLRQWNFCPLLTNAETTPGNQPMNAASKSCGLLSVQYIHIGPCLPSVIHLFRSIHKTRQM